MFELTWNIFFWALAVVLVSMSLYRLVVTYRQKKLIEKQLHSLDDKFNKVLGELEKEREKISAQLVEKIKSISPENKGKEGK